MALGRRYGDPCCGEYAYPPLGFLGLRVAVYCEQIVVLDTPIKCGINLPLHLLYFPNTWSKNAFESSVHCLNTCSKPFYIQRMRLSDCVSRWERSDIRCHRSKDLVWAYRLDMNPIDEYQQKCW